MDLIAGGRDDRILPVTRWVAALLAPVLVAAFVVLYGWPDHTAELFAWTIKPRLTPLLMGAGYLAGAYFFLRVVWARRWHHIAAGYLPVAAFASAMAVATILHWDRFNHAHPAFIVWAALYATTPLVVLAVWLLNRSADEGTPLPGEVLLPRLARWMMGSQGAAILLTGLLLFLLPYVMIGLWPWKLTLLTARAGGAWLMLPGFAWMGMARDPRWSAARLPLQSQAIGLVLILDGMARAWGDFDPANGLTWIFVAMTGLWLAGVVWMTISLEAKSKEQVFHP